MLENSAEIENVVLMKSAVPFNLSFKSVEPENEAKWKRPRSCHISVEYIQLTVVYDF